MAEADPRVLDPEVSLLAQEEAQLHALVERICLQLDVDHGRGLRALTECLRQGYTLFFPALRRLAQEGTRARRQALVRAVAEATDPHDPFRASFLLEILSPMLWDPSAEVRRAARQVLREKMAHVHPEETLELLVQWAAAPDPAQRALAAQMLGHLPAKLTKRALIVLKQLARSEDKHVRRVTLASLRRLAKQSPQVVGPELVRWEEDPGLAPMVQRVLDGQEFPQT